MADRGSTSAVRCRWSCTHRVGLRRLLRHPAPRARRTPMVGRDPIGSEAPPSWVDRSWSHNCCLRGVHSRSRRKRSGGPGRPRHCDGCHRPRCGSRVARSVLVRNSRTAPRITPISRSVVGSGQSGGRGHHSDPTAVVRTCRRHVLHMTRSRPLAGVDGRLGDRAATWL